MMPQKHRRNNTGLDRVSKAQNEFYAEREYPRCGTFPKELLILHSINIALLHDVCHVHA